MLRWERLPPGEAFERQIELLAAEFPVVSVTQVLDTFEGGHALPPGSLLLAFDAEPDFARRAWPILARHRLAAILFSRVRDTPEELAELEELVAAGVVPGLRASGNSPHEPPPEALDDETRLALCAWKRRWPGCARVFAHDVEVPAERDVEFLRAAGVELALTRLAGENDLGRVDPLRLRTLSIAPADSTERLRARLAPGVRRRGARKTEGERRAERGLHKRRTRLQYLHRPLDAVLTAAERAEDSLSPPAWRPSNYERLRSLVGRVTRPLPPVERALRRALLDTRALPLRVASVALAGHGTAATVFRLRTERDPGEVSWVLKVYRWTLGQSRALLWQMARRHHERYRWLEEHFGEFLLPTHFLVLHGPLRGLPVAACLQEEVAEAQDLLALPDEELLAFVRARPALEGSFRRFAQRVLEQHARGFLPDVLGPGNLLHVGRGRRAGLRLIDYGLFDLRFAVPRLPFERADAAARRFAVLLAALEGARPQG